MTITENLPAVQQGGTLAIQPDQAMWTTEQRAVLLSLGVGVDCTNAELAGYLHLCQRRGLDPFLRQVYLIGRWDKREGRNVYRHQTGIDGFRLIARRSADRSGIDYEYEDTIWFAPDGSEHAAWLWDTPPAAAKVVVVRNGRRYDAVARYAAYVQTDKEGKPSGQWRNMADTMTAKCAEALALRKAFPEDLGDIYTVDEMGHLDEEEPREVIPGETIRDTVEANEEAERAGMATKKQRNEIAFALASKGIRTPELALVYIFKVTGRRIERSDELTGGEAAQVMSALNRDEFLDNEEFAQPAESDAGSPLHYTDADIAEPSAGES
jgi:phage recombination protein Bet